MILPNLQRINKLSVTLDERNAAFDTSEEKWERIMEEDSKYEVLFIHKYGC